MMTRHNIGRYYLYKLICSLVVGFLSFCCQADVAQGFIEHSTKPFEVTVEASEGPHIIRSIRHSTENSMVALDAALHECEKKRITANLTVACEPVQLNGESVTTAKELRERAGASSRATTDAKLSLFEVSRHNNGNEQPLYLLGSVHLMKKNVYPLHPAIIERFNASNNLVLEVNMGNVDPHYLQQQFLKHGLLKQHETLAQYLSRDSLMMLDQVLKSRGVQATSLSHMRPWFLEQTLISQEMMLYGFDPQAGVDSYFENLARKEGKHILQLESLDQQLALLSDSTNAEQEQSLRHTLKSFQENKVQQELNSLVVSWLRGDVDRLYSLMIEVLESYPQLAPFISRIFDKRNIAMSRKIETWLKADDSFFVIVGAGHLGGEFGLISLLEKQGYTVKQVERRLPIAGPR